MPPDWKLLLVQLTAVAGSKVNGWLNALLSHVPIVLMALLAIASFIILKQAPTANDTPQAQLDNVSHDHFLQQFATTSYSASGAPLVVLQGESAQHSPQLKEMQFAHIHFIAKSSSSGVEYSGSARKGTVTDGAKQFSLSERVIIDKKAPAATRFEGEQIQFTTDPDTVTSSRPIRIQSGRSTITAGSLHYDNATKLMQLKGRVRMLIDKP